MWPGSSPSAVVNGAAGMIIRRAGCCEAAHEANARALHNRIASAFAELNCLLADVPGFLSGVANYIASEGIGAYHPGMVTLIGLTPSREDFLQLVKFLNKTASGRPWRDISTCLGLIA